MKLWEYKVVRTLPSVLSWEDPAYDHRRLEFDEHGKNGWELVSVVCVADSYNISYAYFKRPLE